MCLTEGTMPGMFNSFYAPLLPVSYSFPRSSLRQDSESINAALKDCGWGFKVSKLEGETG